MTTPSHVYPPSTSASMIRNLPMKPPVAGMPARPSIAIVSGHASHGRDQPRPAIESKWSPWGVPRSRATITANAAMFMTM